MDRLYLGITVTSTYTLVAMALISSVHAIRPPQLAAVSSLSSVGRVRRAYPKGMARR